MKKNPHEYGILPDDMKIDDVSLHVKRKEMIHTAACNLEKCKMIRYHEASGEMYSTDLGRIASHYYIDSITIFEFNEILKERMSKSSILDMVCSNPLSS